MTKTKKNEKKRVLWFSSVSPSFGQTTLQFKGIVCSSLRHFFCSKTFFYKCDLSKTLGRFENKTNGRTDKNYNENGNKRQKKKKFGGAKS